MKKILIYGFYLLAAAALLAGCIRDEAVAPAPVSGDRLILRMPDAQEVALTRAATEAECRIGNLYALVYRGGSLVYKQTAAAAAVTGNGTAQPSVDLNYKVRPGDKIYVVANYPASVGTSLQGLGTGAAESGLSALLVCDNPVYGRVMQRSETQPMYGSVIWSAGSNTCELVRSLAKASVVLDDSGLFAGKTLSFILAGAPQKTSMEVVYDTDADKYEIPNVDGLGGTWSTAVNTDDMIPLTGENYCAPYPISIDAGGVSVDRNTFDKRRSALILCAAAGEAKEYYRLDFSRQLSSTTILGDASNEYINIDPNTHYAFHIRSVKSGGYSTAAEAWQNPGSNIEYTVTVSGDGWKSSTGNGQYLVRTDRDTVLVLKNVAAASDLVKFACQMPDAGQKPGGELPGSVDTRVVTLVGPDKETLVPVENIQLCTSDGTPVENNTFDFSGETIPADGYPLKYIAGASVPAGHVYLRIRYGNIDHYVPLAYVTLYVRTNVNTVTYQGRKDATLDVRSYYQASGTSACSPCPWTAEFSVDGGASWTKSAPDMLSGFPESGRGSYDAPEEGFPNLFKFDVTAQTVAEDNPHNEVLRATQNVSGVYDLSTKGGRTAMNTANCYLVSAPGSYTFPLVYGNGVKDGVPNAAAYAAAGGTNILDLFLNYQDAPIDDPYIYNDPGIQLADACLVWQDAPNLVSGIALAADKQSIRFEVDRSTIRQGNAVIAVRDASGEIVWSWHIWVTDYILGSDLRRVTNFQGNEYTAMPVNVGWCDREVMVSEARSVMVRITQDRTGVSQTFTIDQTAYSNDRPGHNPYFQWGRKDPMLPFVGAMKDKDFYTDLPEYAFDKSGAGKVSVSEAIRHPHVFYNYGSEGPVFDWCTERYLNLWGTSVSGIEHAVGVKTIYDPSPVGYIMPPAGFFTGFSATGGTVSTVSQFNVEGGFDAGWNFYGEKGGKGGLIFLPAVGYRTYVSGHGLTFGNTGYCWSSSTYDYDSGSSYNFTLSEGKLTPTSTISRAAGLSVRAVRE